MKTFTVLSHRDTDVVNILTGDSGTNWESSTDIYTLPCVIIQGAQLGTLWWHRGVGWGVGRDAPEGGDTYINLELIHAVQQKN